jgi:ABC-2 type transport system ATP-binding protein
MMRLHIENIHKAFDDKKVLTGASAVIDQGKISGLIGRNGAGKTTLFNILYGDIPQDQGHLFLEIDGTKRPLRAEDVGLLFSNPLVPEFMTGYECVKLFLDIHNLPSDEASIRQAFELVSLDREDWDRLIRDYSHGMKNKIMMLMVFLAKPPVILLDEPLTSLDIVLAAQIKDFLRSYKQDHIIIMSTHILDLAKSLCDDIILLRKGVLQALPDEKFKDPDFERYLVDLLTDDSNEAQLAQEAQALETPEAWHHD